MVDDTDMISDDIVDNFDILDFDETGHTPQTSKFTTATETVFQIMARHGSKVNAVRHTFVRVAFKSVLQVIAFLRKQLN